MTAGGRGKSRGLSKEERVLWKGITRGIQRLRAATAAENLDSVPAAETVAPPLAPVAPAARQPKTKSPPPLAPLGRRMKQRVARGKDAIDGRLDLHGYTQAQAHSALRQFLTAAQARDARLVVVVTGKGRSRGDAEESGVLRRQVPLWLKLPEFRALVVGFETAHRTHGGEGALYVRVRRAQG
jgi:DNA-nicking Smr family endonuclease